MWAPYYTFDIYCMYSWDTLHSTTVAEKGRKPLFKLKKSGPLILNLIKRLYFLWIHFFLTFWYISLAIVAPFFTNCCNDSNCLKCLATLVLSASRKNSLKTVLTCVGTHTNQASAESETKFVVRDIFVRSHRQLWSQTFLLVEKDISKSMIFRECRGYSTGARYEKSIINQTKVLAMDFYKCISLIDSNPYCQEARSALYPTK